MKDFKKQYRLNKILNSIEFLKQVLLMFFIILFNCSFEPVDLFFKNLDLIPEMLDKEDRTPHLPKDYVNEKTEKIYDPLKMPKGKENAPAEKLISIKGIIKDTVSTTQKDLIKMITPSGDSIIKMFNLSDIGIIDGKGPDIDINPSYLDTSGKIIPMLNTAPVKSMPKKVPIPPGLNAGAKKMEISNPITDIQISGLDDVLPTSVGAPLKTSDYTLDSIPKFFDDFIDKNYNLNQDIMDILP